jgi:HEAT repeat protein
MRKPDPPPVSTRQLVEYLAVPHRALDARRTLLATGGAALVEVSAGLRHPNADVRYHCLALLDHLVVPDLFDEMIAMLRDPDSRVRVMALHALACDRCKTTDCKPVQHNALPEALRLLREDSDAHVRAMAIELIGHFAHDTSVAAEALMAARMKDPSPAVRKKAGWYAPGGAIYTRTAIASN